MALCINQSGTWRNITTQCVNQSGTWRKVTTGCINQSGTWRKFGFASPIASCPLGSSVEGGRLICKASNIAWIVAPNTSEVSRTWGSISDANTRAQQVSGCTGWFVPTISQLQNPGYTCRTYWDSFSAVATGYWSSTEYGSCGCYTDFTTGVAYYGYKTVARCVRAFRCVTY